MSAKLDSYGVDLPCGTYRMWARFAHAINFFHGDDLAALVTPHVGEGPHSLVTPSLTPFLQCDTLTITPTHIHIGAHVYAKNTLRPYIARVPDTSMNSRDVRYRCDVCAATLTTHAPPYSIPHMLASEDSSENFSGIYRSLTAQMKKGLHLFLDGFYTQGIRMIKGLGFGLTPSGDDFLAGFLLGTHLAERVNTQNYSPLRQVIFRHARGNNHLSNAFLRSAYQGAPCAHIHDVMDVIVRGQPSDIPHTIARALTHGATSGADTVHGILSAMRRCA